MSVGWLSVCRSVWHDSLKGREDTHFCGPLAAVKLFACWFYYYYIIFFFSVSVSFSENFQYSTTSSLSVAFGRKKVHIANCGQLQLFLTNYKVQGDRSQIVAIYIHWNTLSNWHLRLSLYKASIFFYYGNTCKNLSVRLHIHNKSVHHFTWKN